MRIEGFTPLFAKGADNVRNRDQQKAPAKAANDSYTPGPASGTDDVAATVAQLKAYIRELPDIREDKVAQAKANVEAGVYDSMGDELADAVINSFGA